MDAISTNAMSVPDGLGHSESSLGLFLVVEGIDGSGKSTIARKLKVHLEECRRKVLLTCEPTNGQFGLMIRQSAKAVRFEVNREYQLFMHDRAEHCREVIVPALLEGVTVISDRYIHSSAAYQGARGMAPGRILAENEKIFPKPDLILYLDIDPETAQKRISLRRDAPDRFDDATDFSKAREIFRTFSSPTFRMIDASRDLESVWAMCLGEIHARFKITKPTRTQAR